MFRRCSLAGARRRFPPSPAAGEQRRQFVEARVKWVRDRALDHAVEKEKHLFPLVALKDLLLSSSSSPHHSLPLAAISAASHRLRLPFRAVRFARLFPAALVEESPSPSAAPLIRPSPELLRIHSDELRAAASDRDAAADRLLRLLMLCPRRQIPLPVIDRLRWDLGLPHDYPQSLLPDFPDYFRIVPSVNHPDLDLELVCYNKSLAFSSMERYASRTGGYKKGMPLAFPLQFPKGFDLEKKVRNWVDEWQKLPYVSPYEDGSRLPPKSDIAEKWTVGVLHEILHLFISKKTEKENLVLIGEQVGLPPGFRKVITHHPGIFYVSNKLRTQTVVLREAYRRDLLIEKHPLMGLRYQYIHLMHKGKENSGARKGHKSKGVASRSPGVHEDEDGEEEEDEDDDELDEISGVSGTESEDEESDDNEDNDNAVRESSLPHVGNNHRPIEVKNAVPRRPAFVRKTNSIESSLRTRKVHHDRSRRTEERQEAYVGMKSHGRPNHVKSNRKLSHRRSTSA